MDSLLQELKTLLASSVVQSRAGGVDVGPLLQCVGNLVKAAKLEKVSLGMAKEKVLAVLEAGLKEFPLEAAGVADKIRMVALPAVEAAFGSLDGVVAACFSWVFALFSRKKPVLRSFESVVPLPQVAPAEEPKVAVGAVAAEVVAPVEKLVLREAEPVLAGEALVEPVKQVEKMD
jgi:hypothetical protein